jgi:1-acyl-sn-glycerol-3-phosphate acyltransferase
MSTATESTPTEAKKTVEPEIVPIHDWIYWTMTWLFKQWFRLGGWKRFGLENVPMQGPVILAPNHASLFDPPLVGCASPRRVTTMGKAELFDKKWFGLKIFPYVIQHMATFPVKRGAPDRRAIRRALKVLDAGEALVIFPEGTRTRTGELGQGEIGLGMIAHSSKAPIVPIYMSGTENALSPLRGGIRLFKTRVYFGQPLRFEEEYARKGDRATLEAITTRVMQEIARLREEAKKT